MSPTFDKLTQNENAFKNLDENKLPGEDLGCNKNIEDLISSIKNYDIDKKHDNKVNEQQLNQNFNDHPQNSIRDQVHMILFSKVNLNDMKSETDDSDRVDKIANESKFYSFDYDDNDYNLLQDDEQYELTDYSSNSSSNNGSYIWREEEEEESIKEAPPNTMFQLFKNVHLNDIKNEPKVPILHQTQSIFPKLPYQHLSKFNSTNEDVQSGTNTNCLNVFDSQAYGQNSNSLMFIINNNQRLDCDLNGSNTTIKDFNYFRKNEIKHQMTGQNSNIINEKRFSIIDSPTKQKIKRMYCNEKRIPLWATDIQEVTKISFEQKKVLKTKLIFGEFHVDNLNLEEIFNTRRFTKPR